MANELKLKLAIEGGQVVGATIDGVSTKIGDLDKRADSASGTLGSLKAGLVGIATVGTALALIHMADAVTSLNSNLRLSVGGTGDARKAYQELFVIAQQTRTNFVELGNTYATLSRAGQELGVSQERMLTVTKAVGYAMTIGGGSAESMKAALVQLGQGLGSGALRGDELNSILEQTPRLAKALADGLGVSIGQLRALGEQGKLTSSAVIEALEKSAPQLAKEMASATVTVGQAYTMLQNSVVKFVGDADSASGASSALAGAMQGLSSAIDTVGNTINKHQTAFTVTLGALGGAALLSALPAIASGIGVVATALKALALLVAANPITLALLGIGAIVGGSVAYMAESAKSVDGMRREVARLNEENERSQKFMDSAASRGNQAGVDNIARVMRERTDRARELNVEISKINASSITGGVGSGDTALAKAQAAAERAAYADAKPLDEVRKTAQLRNDILAAANLEAVNLAKSFSKAIAATDDGEKRAQLMKERDARLIASAAETNAALKSFDDAKAAPGKEAAKQRLETTIQLYEAEQIAITAGEQRSQKVLQAQHAAGLVSDYGFYAQRMAMALAANAEQQEVLGKELDAVKASNIGQAEKLAALGKYNSELKKLKESEKGIVEDFNNDMLVLDAKRLKAQLDAQIASLDAQNKDNTALAASNLKLREQVEEIGLTVGALDQLRLARMDAAIAQEQLRLSEASAHEANEAELAVIKRRIELLKEERALTTRGQNASAAVKQADEATKAWQKTADSIYSGLTDSLYRAFEAGNGFFDTFWKGISNTLKTTVLRVGIEAAVSGIVGPQGGSSSALGGASGVGQMVKMFDSGISTISKIFSPDSFAASVSSGIGDLGAALVSNSGSSEALSNFGAQLINNSDKLGKFAQSAGNALSYLDAASKFKDGSYGESIGQGVGTFFGGPIGGQIGQAIGSAVDRLFGKGEYVKSTGNAGISFDPTGTRTSTAKASDFRGFDANLTAAADSFVVGLNTAYLNLSKTLGIKSGYTQFNFGSNNSDGGKFNLGGASNGSTFQSGEIKSSDEAVKLAASRAVLAALKGSELPGYLAKVLDGLTASTATQAQIDSSLAYASSLKQIRDALTETRTPLQVLQDTVGEAFTSLGTSAANFKTDFVAAIDAGIAPDKLALWQTLGANMEALATASGQANTELVSAARSLSEIANERSGLQKQLDELTLSNTELLAKQRAALDASNQALFDEVQAAQTAKDAKTKLEEAEKVRLEERKGLQEQLNALTDTSAQALERQRAALDSSNQALFDQVQAAQAAKTALEAFRGAMSTLGDAKFDLQNQLLALQGNQAEVDQRVRERELARLTEGIIDPARIAEITGSYDENVALKKAIKDLQDSQEAAKKAAESQASAATEATRAADQVRSAWQSVTDSAFNEVNRIRGLMGGDNEQSLAAAQARFAITTAQARAGDQEAYKLLPQLSQAVTALAETNTGSRVDLLRIQAQTAASLEYTATMLAAQYGLTVPKFAKGGDHAGGWAMVGEEGPELAYLPPARIYTASNTRSMLSGGSNNSDLAGLVDLLGRRLEEMKTKLDTANRLLQRTADATNGRPENVPRMVLFTPS